MTVVGHRTNSRPSGPKSDALATEPPRLLHREVPILFFHLMCFSGCAVVLRGLNYSINQTSCAISDNFIPCQLETWWEEVTYLNSRLPSAPLINIAGPVPGIPDCMQSTNSTHVTSIAALFTHAILLIWKRLYR